MQKGDLLFAKAALLIEKGDLLLQKGALLFQKGDLLTRNAALLFASAASIFRHAVSLCCPSSRHDGDEQREFRRGMFMESLGFPMSGRGKSNGGTNSQTLRDEYRNYASCIVGIKPCLPALSKRIT